LIADWRLPIDYSKRRERPIENRQLAIDNELVHVIGLARTKDNQVRLISKEGAFAAQPHMRAWNSDFKSHTRDFKSEIHLC